jgi:hypothetical protein|tara:strand:- start:978 stop:1325 length:348 start_codon:yes stop_codon:yes gene_type:complete
MNKLLASMSLILMANIITWFQLQGHFWSNKLIWKSPYFIMLVGAIISPLFWYATKFSYEHFGQYWNIRLIGFGLGTVVFGIMSWAILDEVPTLKTIICLLLAASIVLIQITNVVE